MVQSCCAPFCRNKFTKGETIKYFRFPNDDIRRIEWTLALRRAKLATKSKLLWNPSRYSRICNEHFATGKPSLDPSDQDYIPTIFNKSKKRKKRKQLRKKSKSKVSVSSLIKKNHGKPMEVVHLKDSGGLRPKETDSPELEVEIKEEDPFKDIPELCQESNMPLRNLPACFKCNKAFSSESELSIHMVEHSSVIFECDACDIVFGSEEFLTLHQISCHDERGTYSCLLCPESFATECDLKRHNDDDHAASMPEIQANESFKITYQSVYKNTILLPDWLKAFPWVTYDPINKKMFCQPCRLSYIPESPKSIKDEAMISKFRNGILVLGTDEVEMSSLVKHRISKGHKIALLNLGRNNVNKIDKTATSRVCKKIKGGNYTQQLNDKDKSKSPELTGGLGGVNAKNATSLDALVLINDESPSIASHSTLIQQSKTPLPDVHPTNKPLANLQPYDASNELAAMPDQTQTNPDQELERLCRNAHAIVKNNRPFKDFCWMISLDETKGIRYGPDHRTEADCHMFVKSIAQAITEEFNSRLREAKFVSILYDACADVSETEHEVLVYVQFALQGIVYTYFVMKMETNKLNSDGIYEVFAKLIEILGPDFKNKVAAIVIDGVSTSHDFVSDAFYRVRKDFFGSIVEVRCLIHRIEIGSKEAIKSPMFESVSVMLNTLYAVYNRNSRKNFIKHISKSVPSTFPVKIRDTHWVLDTLTALTTLWKGFRSILGHLSRLPESEKTMKIKVLLKLLRSETVIGYSHVLLDILVPLSKLVSELKRTDLTISKCCHQFKNILKVLDDLKKPGFYLKMFLNRKTFHGWKLFGSFPHPDDTADRLKYFLQHRYEAIQRFSITNIVDLVNWPSSFGKTKEQDFGKQEIHCFLSWWKEKINANNVDTKMIKTEWSGLKMALFKDGLVQNTNWYRINWKHKEEFPNILDLIDLLLSLPTGYAECSQGFHCAETIKRDYGGRFSGEEESDIIRIKLLSPDIDAFNPIPAIHCFKISASANSRSGVVDLGSSVSDEEPECSLDEYEEETESASEADDEFYVSSQSEDEDEDGFDNSIEDFQYRKLLEIA